MRTDAKITRDVNLEIFTKPTLPLRQLQDSDYSVGEATVSFSSIGYTGPVTSQIFGMMSKSQIAEFELHIKPTKFESPSQKAQFTKIMQKY